MSSEQNLESARPNPSFDRAGLPRVLTTATPSETDGAHSERGTD